MCHADQTYGTQETWTFSLKMQLLQILTEINLFEKDHIHI